LQQSPDVRKEKPPIFAGEPVPAPPDMAKVLIQVATWTFLFYGKSTGFVFSNLL